MRRWAGRHGVKTESSKTFSYYSEESSSPWTRDRGKVDDWFAQRMAPQNSASATVSTSAASPTREPRKPSSRTADTSAGEPPTNRRGGGGSGGGKQAQSQAATSSTKPAATGPDCDNWREASTFTPTPSGGSSGSGAGRGRGKGGGSSGHGDANRDVKISKALTQILRHRAQTLGVHIRNDGFCQLRQVMQVRMLNDLQCCLADVQKVVRDSDKQRFELREEFGAWMIRATQGHSMKVVDDELLLERLDVDDPELPRSCVHGSYRRNWDGIMKDGLLAGGPQGNTFRNHVHFAPFEPGDGRVISGMRYDCDLAIWIDLSQALHDGMPFYRSANQVLLSPGFDGVIQQKYFIKAKDLKSGDWWDISGVRK